MNQLSLPSMFDHQSDQIGDVRNVLKSKTHRLNLAGKDENPDYVDVRSVILQASPGTGKTRMAKWMLINSLLNMASGKVLFTVHRRNLVINASDSFNQEFEDGDVFEYRLPHGVVMSNHETSWDNRCFVTSIDSMNSWWIQDGVYSETADVFDIVVIDEVHFHFSKHLKYVKAHEIRRRQLGLKPAIYIGLSATPANKHLYELFSTIIPGKSTQWLIDHKFLVPFRYFSGIQGKTEVLKKSGGKMGYTEESVVQAMEGMAGDLVRDWKTFGEGRPTVGFFTTLAEAKQAAEDLEAAGVKVAYIDGNTSDEHRALVFKQMAIGEVTYTCNVGVIEIGTNIPEVACIQLCTKVGSRQRLEQILGRGSRNAPGKVDCIVIDHLGNIAGVDGHGWFEDEYQWVIEQAKPIAVGEEAGRAIVTCPKCKIEYRGGKCSAPGCDYEPTPRELKAQGLAFSGTEMKEIIRPAKEKAKPKQQSMEKIIENSIYATAHRNGSFSQAFVIARKKAEGQGQKFVLPATITVHDKTYEMPGYGDPNGKRKVKALFDFVKHIGRK